MIDETDTDGFEVLAEILQLLALIDRRAQERAEQLILGQKARVDELSAKQR